MRDAPRDARGRRGVAAASQVLTNQPRASVLHEIVSGLVWANTRSAPTVDEDLGFSSRAAAKADQGHEESLARPGLGFLGGKSGILIAFV